MKSNSLFKSLRIGSRKNKHSTTSEGSELESSTKGKTANPNNVSATPAVALDVETLGNDVSQNQLAVLESSIPRSITPTLKDQHILHPLHKSTTSNLMPLEGQFPVDIIAVHGLNGGAHKTWTHANNHFWLQDDLPDAFPGARVYSYGYPAEVLLTREKSDMADFARDLLRAVNDERTTPEAKRRPLIFMCHSMGGIVVKKAFNISVVDQEDYGAIRKAVPAIMFFATPHGGSGYANFFSKLARVSNGPLAGAGGLKIRHDLIKSLKKDSSVLADISMDFRRHTKDLKIFSFLEKATTPPLSEKVVDDSSALLYAANETPIPMLGCDHRTICRFSGKEDPNYNKVFKILQRVVTDATTKYEAELVAEDEPCLHSLFFQTMNSRQLETTLSTPHPQSCTWILTHPSYLSWVRSNSKPLLWIKGHPGTGKSTLMSYLSHHPSLNQAPDIISLSFFFHGNGTFLQKSELGMFRCLLHQIYSQDFLARKIILGYFQRRVKESGECGREWEWQVPELREILNSILILKEDSENEGPFKRREKDVVIFVDALDESVSEKGEKAAKHVLDYFFDMCGRAKGRVKVVVSSRHYPVVAPLMERCVVVNVEEGNRGDIATFVSRELTLGVETWGEEDENERRELEGALVRKADGVFLWVKMRLGKIVKGLNDGVFSLRDIREMVEEETNELSTLYKGILMSDVDVGLRDKAFRMMHWVCLAERPLSLGELRYAMGCDLVVDKIEEDEDVQYEEVKAFVDEDSRMQKLVKSLSGGLAQVTYYSKETVVQLFHQSVNDFLRTEGLAILRRSINSNDSEDGEELIGICEDRMTRACLRYLYCGEILERANTWKEGIQTTYIFIQYATEYWAVHAGRAENRGVGQEHLVDFFASRPTLLETWIALYKKGCVPQILNSGIPFSIKNLLHVASLFGLQSTAIYLLQHGSSLNDERDGYYEMPLALAAQNGHEKLVQKYIDLGASLDYRVAGWPTPLEIAAASNQFSTVKILLNNGARLDNGMGIGSALRDAAAAGNVELIRVLLNGGANVNLIKDFHGTALQAAAQAGKEGAVEFLIKNGADVNARGGYFGSALQAAIFGPEELRQSIVRCLLEKGADVNLQEGAYGNVLQNAAHARDDEIVELLLKNGANVNANGGKYGTALQAAALGYQNIKMMKLLIAHGADINAQGGEYGTALQAAATTCDDGAKLLINLGADINATGGYYGNVLQAAVSIGEGGTLVPLLLERGARIEDRGGYYGNVLQAAIATGNENLAKHFLSLGMDINETGGHFGDNLQAAFPACRDSFIEYLLGQGANVNTSGGKEHGSPLRAAIYWNRPTMVRIFLAHGADPNERIELFPGTPLQQAASRKGNLSAILNKRSLEVVRILLDAGANIEDKDLLSHLSQTPLHIAIDYCNKEVVKLLIARGARLDVSEERRRALDRILEVE